jgi:hypothetical protein
MTRDCNDLLKRVIETQHGAIATFHHSVQVARPTRFNDWDGVVHIFTLAAHRSRLAYAWSLHVQGGACRCFAVLHGGRVNGPEEAVKAAATAIQATMLGQKAPRKGGGVRNRGGLWA